MCDSSKLKTPHIAPCIDLASHATVGGLFSVSAKCNPNKIALIEGERKLTYVELEQRSNQLAQAFVELGVERGERIAVFLHNCIEYIEIELAAAKCGAIVAALNWRLADRELKHCVELVEPKLFITDPANESLMDRLDCEPVKQILLGADYENRIAEQGSENLSVEVEPEDGLVILYTSGTTGMPKGALINHRAMIARAGSFTSELGLKRDAGFIAWAPLFHMASTDHSLATLMRGGTVHVVDGYQPETLMDIAEQDEIGWFVVMPGMVGEFAELCKKRKLKPKGITACGAMADLVPAEHIAACTRVLNAPYLNTFGATETGLPPASGNTIAIGVTPTNLAKVQSAFVELRLVDPDDNEVPTGEPGEVALRGPTLFSGYWGAHEVNAHDFRNGWFHMGDVMRRNPDGTLSYVDRVKYLIKSGGENIYPAEIEQVLLADVRVEQAVVIRQEHEKWGEVPMAFVVLKDPDCTASELKDLCRQNLARYKCPNQIMFVDDVELPRSTTGKIQRHILEERFSSGSLAQ